MGIKTALYFYDVFECCYFIFYLYCYFRVREKEQTSTTLQTSIPRNISPWLDTMDSIHYENERGKCHRASSSSGKQFWSTLPLFLKIERRIWWKYVLQYTFTNRFEMPYNIWCDGCNNHIGMGVRYNAEKSKIGNYYTTPIYQFRMKCHLCDNHFEIKTDPAVSSKPLLLPICYLCTREVKIDVGMLLLWNKML